MALPAKKIVPSEPLPIAPVLPLVERQQYDYNRAVAEYLRRLPIILRETIIETGATSPGGADTQVQYNDGGSFGGEASFTYNKTTDTLTAVNIAGAGAALTNLNASSLASGTVATARLGSGTANSSTFLRGDQTWASAATSPGGSNTHVQYNSGGAFAGEAAFTYNSGTDTLTVTNIAGAGAAITGLNAANLATGTVPTARLGSGTANSTTYLRGDSTWATVTATASESEVPDIDLEAPGLSFDGSGAVGTDALLVSPDYTWNCTKYAKLLIVTGFSNIDDIAVLHKSSDDVVVTGSANAWTITIPDNHLILNQNNGNFSSVAAAATITVKTSTTGNTYAISTGNTNTTDFLDGTAPSTPRNFFVVYNWLSNGYILASDMSTAGLVDGDGIARFKITHITIGTGEIKLRTTGARTA